MIASFKLLVASYVGYVPLPVVYIMQYSVTYFSMCIYVTWHKKPYSYMPEL